MGNYRLSVVAKDDLKRIYLYGLSEFGEAQADRYFAELHAKLLEIADHPLRYQAVDDVRPDIDEQFAEAITSITDPPMAWLKLWLSLVSKILTRGYRQLAICLLLRRVS